MTTAYSLKTRIAIAFGVIYLVWGSTYLGIRVMVTSEPPILSGGVRFLIAGALMMSYALWRGQRLPRAAADWRNLILIGLIMLAGANGMVNWSEQWVDSNQAALIVATSALWMAGMGTLGKRGEPLGSLTIAGLLLGFAGVAVLVSDGLSLRAAPWQAYAVLQLSPFLWALGSVYAKRNPVGCGPLMSAAVQTLAAGVVMTVIGLANGEAARWQWQPRALIAMAYLIVFGSCIAYATYYWLVHQVSPATLSTYAYINPAVAVLLGWWLLDEHLSPTQLAGTGIILGGVVIVTLAQRRIQTRT